MVSFQSVISLHMSVLTGVLGTSRFEELNHLKEKSPDVDRGWAFLVVLVSFVGHILVYGPSWTYGILYVTFLEDFGQLPSVTAWIGTISAAFTLLGGPIASTIINRFGNRTATLIGCLISTLGLGLSSWANNVQYLCVTFGLLSGIGWSISYIPLVNILGEYFCNYRKLAIGLATSGAGMGLFVYPPLLTTLNEHYHWRGTMLIIAALNLNLLVSAAVFMPPRLSPRQSMEKKLLLDESLRRAKLNKSEITASVISIGEKRTIISAKAYLQQLLQLDVFMSPHYILLAFNNAFFAFCASIVFTHISNFAKSYHYHAVYCSILISVMGALNTFGRVSLGFIIQHPKVNVIGTYVICYLSAGIVTIPIAYVHTYPAFVVFAACFGFCSAAFGTVTPEVIIYICGLRRLASAYGYVLVFEALGMVLGGPAAGWVLESFHEYDGCFVMAGCAAVLSAVLLIPSWWILGRYRGMADAGAEIIERAEDS